MRRLYLPSTGTEGADFWSKWCANCKRDEAFRDGTGDSCPILANSYCGIQPEEWHVWRGDPVCDAFEGDEYPHLSGFAVRDLFPAAPRRPTQGEAIRMMLTPQRGALQ